MDIGAGIVLGVGIVALAVLLIVVTLRGRRDRARMGDEAARRGWSYAAGVAPVNYTLSGVHEGLAFELVSRRPAGLLGDNRGAAPTVTALTADAPRIDGAAIILPPIGDGAESAVPRALMDGPFRTMIVGDEAADVAGLSDVTGAVGAAAAARVSVEATSVGIAERLLDAPARTALDALRQRLGAENPVIIVRSASSITVRVLGQITALDDITAMAELASRMRGSD